MKVDPGRDFGCRSCPACACKVPENANRCPICGYAFPALPRRQKLVIWAAVGMLLLFLLMVLR